ncbi:E3 ubiquitin-protein ligase bre1 [Sorochytrium milnesiophthora]
MSSRKRVLDADDDDSSSGGNNSKSPVSASSQPEAKRFMSLAAAQSSSPSSPAFNKHVRLKSTAPSTALEVDSQDALNTYVESFQKEALWRELEEQKRSNAALTKQLERSTSLQKLYGTRLTQVTATLSILNEDLHIEAAKHQSPTANGKDRRTQMETWERERWTLLQSGLVTSPQEQDPSTATDALIRNVKAQQQRLVEQCQALWRHISAAHHRPSDDDANATSAEHSSLALLNDQLTSSNAQYRVQIAQLQAQLALSEQRLQESERNLSDTTQSLTQLQRLINRQSCPVTNMAFQTGEYQPNNGTLQRSESTRSDLDVPATAPLDISSQTSTLLGSAPASPIVVVDDQDSTQPTSLTASQIATALPSPASTTSAQEAAGLAAIASVRLAEVEALKEQVVTLQKSNDEMTLKLAAIPDVMILQHPLTEQLRKDLAYCQGELAHWKSQYDRIFAQMNDLKEEHKRYLDQLAADRKVQNEQYAAQCSTLNAEAVRLRQARDEAQAARELLLAEKKVATSSTEEVRKTANLRKIRIDMLQNEIKRLRATIADGAGFRFLAEMFAKTGEASSGNMSDSAVATYESNLKSLHTKVDQLQQELVTARKLASGNPSESQDIGNLAALQSQVAHYERILGPGAETTAADLPALLERKQTDLDALRDQLAKKNQEITIYMNEMNSLAEEYAKIDASTTKHALLLVEHEEQLTKLVHEKMKLAERSQNLRKKCDLLKTEASLAKRESNKFMEHVRNVEEKEKAVHLHVAALEREIRLASEAIKMHKERAMEVIHQAEMLKAELDRVKPQYLEMEDLLHKRTELYNNERQERRKWQEEAESAKARLERTAHKATGHDDKSDLLAKYRQLLMCSACNTRFKDTVITRCMHTFCRQCVQDRIDTRQRKCPTCREGFGTADVQTIYL